ncbi:putative tRNA (uracil-O(2)-)-methyltransferase [Parambassis ranga]|uniref:tRNA (uracil-O(2)-)-methyltransferase n=1 Tax=Parambassis ranga TaxID=210632 RepID=A0A6P7K6F1_9TELE|nr:probable tRNA (uracil-O(2)-)-methyltransferase [Parambassis ranga]XP_028284960.1 probable tRNA (uracil-O(2)-)-methyltransferase [Parambassis ranga]XP_028284961.1 probable tRNA (uracil-O(2)-)-methyltransferase [Parambassis ranga]
MPKLCAVKFPGECKTLPEGFWSAVDVWVKKPHVVNKRLCGVKETESKDVDRGELLRLLGNTEVCEDVLLFLNSELSPAQTHAQDKPWSSSVRTFIPKVNSYGTNQHKEVLLKDFDRQRVTFIPFEEDAEGKVSLKKGNIYQIQLCSQDCEEWVLELHVLSTDLWVSDGVAYPKLPWLSSDLLPKLVRWATECKSSEFRSTLSLLPVEKYSVMYQQLKEKYKAMVKVWPEVTDPEKFVYEDVAIATYLLVLWAEERAEKSLTDKQSFVDLGCGNGLLVHILTNEGHPGKGIDVRRRRIWDMYGPQTQLEEKAITPSESFLFPGTDWLIGNHSDELTPWIPVIAARSSYSSRYFVLPCCFFDFCGKYQRRQSKKSQYKEYIDFITEVSQVCGFNTEEDCLRIPSTKRVCLIGKSRSYLPPDEAEAEQRRSHYIQSRQTACGVAVQRSDTRKDMDCCHGNTDSDGAPGYSWGAGFQPRDRVEMVRNCATLSRDFVDGVVLQVATVLLGMTVADSGGSSSEWNQGGSLSVSEVAGLLEQETLQLLKKECGGLQTLLKNNHQVFRVEGGRVYIRDGRDRKSSKTDAKRKPVAPGALKTRLCWFHTHHPQGCPLQAEDCAFAHGPDDLRPSTRPLKKLKQNNAF